MPHRRRHEPLEELADAHIDEHEADAEQSAPHDVDADQARQKKLDVLRPIAFFFSGPMTPSVYWRDKSASTQ